MGDFPRAAHRNSNISELNQKHIRPSGTLFLVTSLVLLRVLVAFHHHSGESDYHGKIDAYGGDYEAQRHWMELTYHLPIGKWYTYDLEYWGLDYPPLTAYVSYVCGWLSEILVGPETVALFESRAYEDVTHKAFMRGTVLVLDVLIYFSAVWFIAKRLQPSEVTERIWTVVLALAQPSVILIDHGHFQYNTVSLGLALWAFHFMTLGGGCPESVAAGASGADIGSFSRCIIGSILFCLSLNFKQMALYYAPAVFAYLLGRCFVPLDSNQSERIWSQPLMRFFSLGVTVILSFLALWMPFVIFRSEDDSPVKSVLNIVSRLFPFQRGLFEGKVSNIWCALSIKPFSFRRRVPAEIQPLLALALTLMLSLPACYKLFRIGQQGLGAAGTKLKGEGCDKKNMHGSDDHHLRMLLWGAASTSISFFLASFQVHEKSILLTISPVSLLVSDAPLLACWFSAVSVWTLWPLVEVDRINGAYFVCTSIFCLLVVLYDRPLGSMSKYASGNFGLKGGLHTSKWIYAVLLASVSCMVGLHVLDFCVEAPKSLPDLFPVLWSVSGCGMFCISWLCFNWQLFGFGKAADENRSDVKKGD